MRKHVKPAHSQAAIPDPVRGGDLPPEGLTVEWSVHWARLAQRGDIVVKDLDEGPKPAKGEKRTPKGSASRAAPTNRRKAAKAPATTRVDTEVPVPLGDAPAETGPQPEGVELESPAAPAAPEPSIT